MARLGPGTQVRGLKTRLNPPQPPPLTKGGSVAGGFLRVHAKLPTFRRAGFVFGREPTDLPRALLNDGQIAALKAEPMLVVEEIDADA